MFTRSFCSTIPEQKRCTVHTSHDVFFSFLLCGSRNYPYYPQGRSLEIPRGRGDLKAKLLEGQYEAKLEFPGGCSVGGGEYGYFLELNILILWDWTVVTSNFDAIRGTKQQILMAKKLSMHLAYMCVTTKKKNC